MYTFELVNGFFVYRSVTAEEELSVLPVVSRLQSVLQRFEYQTKQFAFGQIEEAPFLALTTRDLEPVLDFCSSAITKVVLDDADLDWATLEREEKHGVLMRLGFIGVLNLCKEIGASNRLVAATKKK